MTYPLLHIDQLKVGFRTETGIVNAIGPVSLSVNKGEVLALVGESGSGKSVTSMSILRLLPEHAALYQNGAIWFSEDGIRRQNLLSVTRNDLIAIRGQKIAMIFQEPMSSLNPVVKCGEQVMEAILAHENVSRREARARMLGLFEKVRLPEPSVITNRYPHQLSGGQKQRVMIAMAMSCRPSLLICDEPTTALDISVQESILQLIRELQREENMGVIFISHDLGVVEGIADRIAVMYSGLIVETGSREQIMKSPGHPYTKALLECRPALHPRDEYLPVVNDFVEIDDSGQLSPREASVTRKKKNIIAPVLSGTPVIEARDLEVSFSRKHSLFGSSGSEKFIAVDQVNLKIFPGETLGLVGESGSGKTTLGRALLMLRQPTGGEIFFKDEKISGLDSRGLRPYRKKMQLIFQDPFSSLNPGMSIGAAIGETLKIHFQMNANERKAKAIYLLERVGLAGEYYNRYPHEFSGGQRQRIVIARALALEPEFIVCDESVSALDVSVQAQVLNLLSDLKQEFGFSALFITHDIAVVRYISDRIVFMEKGRLRPVEAGEELFGKASPIP